MKESCKYESMSAQHTNVITIVIIYCVMYIQAICKSDAKIMSTRIIEVDNIYLYSRYDLHCMLKQWIDAVCWLQYNNFKTKNTAQLDMHMFCSLTYVCEQLDLDNQSIHFDDA